MPARPFSWSSVFAWTVAIAVHSALAVLVLVPPAQSSWPDPSASEPTASAAVEAIAVTLPPRQRPPSMPKPPVAPAMSGGRPSSPARQPASASTNAMSSPPPVDAEIVPKDRFYDDAGRPRLPDEPLYAATPAAPDQYRMPGDGSEDDVFYRPSALATQEDRIAFRWEPRVSAGAEWYGRLVRATSVKTTIPLGPKFSLVCGASLAGLGGACMIQRNGGTGVIVQRSADPPPWERVRSVQCRGLREELEKAEDPARITWLLDRLLALCSAEPAPDKAETTTPGTGPGVGATEARERQSDLADS